jgi:hypothetical protein
VGRAVAEIAAPAELIVLAEAVALVEHAELGGGAEALLLADGDDVDDSGDRIRAVDRGGAGLEHLDPLDHAFGDGVQIGRARHAARRGAVDVAQAVEKDEGPLRTEIAQVDLGRAGTDAAAIGRGCRNCRYC